MEYRLDLICSEVHRDNYPVANIFCRKIPAPGGLVPSHLLKLGLGLPYTAQVVSQKGIGGSFAEIPEVTCERCHLCRWNQRQILSGVPQGARGGPGTLRARGGGSVYREPPPLKLVHRNLPRALTALCA
jgi:hypothetical protein